MVCSVRTTDVRDEEPPPGPAVGAGADLSRRPAVVLPAPGSGQRRAGRPDPDRDVRHVTGIEPSRATRARVAPSPTSPWSSIGEVEDTGARAGAPPPGRRAEDRCHAHPTSLHRPPSTDARTRLGGPCGDRADPVG